MKKTLLLLLIASAAIIAGCSKDKATLPAPETKQGVNLNFVVNKNLTGGGSMEVAFKANIVMIWKSDGKDFVYNGPNDGEYAMNGTVPVKADYSYLDIKSQQIELIPGKYFIAIVTDNTTDPRFANSYTTFIVKAGTYTDLKKNVSTMANFRYTSW